MKDSLAAAYKRVLAAYRDGGLEAAVAESQKTVNIGKAGEEALSAMVVAQVLVANERHRDATKYLLEASAHPNTRTAALVMLAPTFDPESASEVIPVFSAVSPLDPPEVQYAAGLAYWRAGDLDGAVRKWAPLLSMATGQTKAALELAFCQRAACFLARGYFGECIETLSLIPQPLGEVALGVVRSALIRCYCYGLMPLARKAASLLEQSEAPTDKAMRFLAMDVQALRAEEIIEATKSKSLSADMRIIILRSLALTLALDGRVQEARALLANEETRECPTLLAVVDCLAAKGRRPAPLNVDWRFLRSVCADSPMFVTALVGQPAPNASTEEAFAFYVLRGEHQKALPLLEELLQANPYDPVTIRNAMVLAFARAEAARPCVDEDAWLDCVAFFTAMTENARWMGRWVLNRLDVYGGANDDPDQRVRDVLARVRQRFENCLTGLEAEAANRGDGDALQRLLRIRQAFALERKAASAMYKLGKLKTPDQELCGFGPLFASRLGLQETVRRLLAELAHDSVVNHDSDDPAVTLRRCFSDLSEAMAHIAQAEYEQAKLKAIAVWGRTTFGPDDGFYARNLAFSEPDGPKLLRLEAAAVACEASIAAFRAEVCSPNCDPLSLQAQFRRILTEAEVLNRESETRKALTRIVYARCKGLVESETPEDLRLARDILKVATSVRLSGLQDITVLVLHRLADQARSRGWSWRAAQYLEEAVQADPANVVLGVNLVMCYLEASDQAKKLNKHNFAKKMLDRASTVASEVRQRAPNASEALELPTIVEMVRREILPVADVVKRPEGSERTVTATPLPQTVRDAFEACKNAKARGDTFCALSEAVRAFEAAPEHPDTAAVLAHAVMWRCHDNVDSGLAKLYDQAESALRTAVTRYPKYWAARNTLDLMGRYRVLFRCRGCEEQLHAQALRCWMAKRFGEAIALLQVAVAISRSQDPEALLLLAESLVEGAQRESGNTRMALLERARKLTNRVMDMVGEHVRLWELQQIIGDMEA